MLDTLTDIRQRLRAKAYHNEEHVRLSLVARLVQQLGWDIWDPSEVYAEFKATRKEDHTRVDLALFTHDFEATTIFIECKGVGGLTKDLTAVEKQLRDYNRDHTALFTLLTDGRHWRFYYSFTSGEFKDKLFCKFDLLTDDLEEVADHFDTFLRRDSISNHTARHKAEAYLTLGKKERAMQDVLPDAQKLVSQPPFPSLPQAMVQLLAAKILTITVGEAQDFLLGNPLRPAAPGALPASESSSLLTFSQSITKPKPISKPQTTRQLKTQLNPVPEPVPTPVPAVAEPAASTLQPLFVLERPKAGLRAEAHWLPTGQMRVLAGSAAAGTASGSLSETGHKLRQTLLQTSVLQAHGQFLRFTQDYEFDSPNRAAELVCGGSVNARVAWQRASDGQTLGSYLAEHPVGTTPPDKK